MKYFEQLSKIEDQVIRLDTIASILRVTASSEAEEADIKNILWQLEKDVTDINDKLSYEFYDLWNEVRDDTWHVDAPQSEEGDFAKHLRFQHILDPFVPKEE